MGRDNNIYGLDDTDFAKSVWTDALGSPANDPADYWGSVQDTRAQAQANIGKESLGPSGDKTPTLDGNLAGGGDNERLTSPYPQMSKFPRHVPGPRTSKDEGGGVKSPPPRNQTATRKGG